jgi:hypothetical protein
MKRAGFLPPTQSLKGVLSIALANLTLLSGIRIRLFQWKMGQTVEGLYQGGCLESIDFAR